MKVDKLENGTETKKKEIEEASNRLLQCQPIDNANPTSC